MRDEAPVCVTADRDHGRLGDRRMTAQHGFDLGARSITVVRALTELRQHGFRSLTAAQIYEHPSVARLAAWLGGDAPPPVADAALRGERQRAALARFGPRTESSL